MYSAPALPKMSIEPLRSDSVIDVEYSAKALPATDTTAARASRNIGPDQAVMQALVIPFAVIVHHVFGNGSTQ